MQSPTFSKLIRLDTQLADHITAISKESGISVNALIEGVLMDRFREGLAHVGEPVADKGTVSTKKDLKIVWFGMEGPLVPEPKKPDEPAGHVDCILDHRRRNAPMSIWDSFKTGFKNSFDPRLARFHEVKENIEKAPTISEAIKEAKKYPGYVKDPKKGKKP